MSKIITLADMGRGMEGNIVSISGGKGLDMKLEGMGIRVGCRIKMIRSQALKGPVIISSGSTQVAIGFGMARNISVEVLG